MRMSTTIARLRFAAIACAAALVAAPASAARAHTSASCSSMPSDLSGLRPTTADAALASVHGATVRRVLRIDFDRDGDLDMLAATDGGVLLWLNDGRGHLVRQEPHSAPALDARDRVNRWRDTEQDSNESIQDDLPSLRLPPSYAHAPPSDGPDSLPAAAVAPPGDACAGALIPRAPPNTRLFL